MKTRQFLEQEQEHADEWGTALATPAHLGEFFGRFVPAMAEIFGEPPELARADESNPEVERQRVIDELNDFWGAPTTAEPDLKESD